MGYNLGVVFHWYLVCNVTEAILNFSAVTPNLSLSLFLFYVFHYITHYLVLHFTLLQLSNNVDRLISQLLSVAAIFIQTDDQTKIFLFVIFN